MAAQTLIRYILSVLLYVLLLPVSSVAAFVIPAFTRAQYSANRQYTWGGWFGTYDNPPQGDTGFVTKRAPFPNCTRGFRGYVNRVAWMRRNRLYGLKRKLALDFKEGTVKVLTGEVLVSDKYRIPGTLRTECLYAGKAYAFEYYKVLPWGPVAMPTYPCRLEGQRGQVHGCWRLRTIGIYTQPIRHLRLRRAHVPRHFTTPA